jgi:hypothetical protein
MRIIGLRTQIPANARMERNSMHGSRGSGRLIGVPRGVETLSAHREVVPFDQRLQGAFER